MFSDPETVLAASGAMASPPILERKFVRTCHILLPDTPQPVGAIAYQNKFYSYVKFYPTLEAAQRAAARMMRHGNTVLLTQIPKGLVLWVFEPDAQPTQS